jgi:hypothetical protein
MAVYWGMVFSPFSMAIVHPVLTLPTDDSIGIYNVTTGVQAFDSTQIISG